MNNDILFAFGIFQLIFLALDIYILSKTGRDIARKGEYTWFCVLIMTHMVYLIANTIWTMHEYNMLNIPRSVLMIICTISLWSVTNCATTFFFFVEEKLQHRSFLSGTGRWIRLLPAFVSSLLILSNLFTGMVFSLSSEGYFIHEKLYLPTLIIAALYLVMVAAESGLTALQSRTSFHRQANGAVFGSVLVIILFVLLDGMMKKASILPAAVFAVVIVIFVNMQEANINSDALTGMNNRRKADEYLSDKLTSISASDPLYLYMGDLNGFKKINDTYGHTEGDEALILCSRALKQTIGRYNGFAARFGGDEFLLAWQPGRGKECDPESLVNDVNTRLTELSAEKPYRLVMSIGYSLCDDPKKTLNACIKQADEMLYRRKAATGAVR